MRFFWGAEYGSRNNHLKGKVTVAKTVRKIIEIAIVSLLMSGSTIYISFNNETIVNKFIGPMFIDVVQQKIGKAGFLTETDVKKIVDEKIGEAGSPAENDVKEQMNALKKKVSALEDQVSGRNPRVNAIKAQVDAIEAQVNAIKVHLNGLETKTPKTESSIGVKLFWSKRNEDKGLLVLNRGNPAIDRLLQNDCFYTLTTQNPMSLRLKSRLDRGVLDEKDNKTTDSLGRIHYNQVDQLFKDSKRQGFGLAKVQLPPVSCEE